MAHYSDPKPSVNQKPKKGAGQYLGACLVGEFFGGACTKQIFKLTKKNVARGFESIKLPHSFLR